MLTARIRRNIYNDGQLKNIRASRIFNSLGLYRITGPTLIGVEPTNRCNLKCRMCSRNFWDESKNVPGDMPISLFMENIAPYVNSRVLSMQVYGEPLLAKNIMPMIKEGKKRRAIVGFTTNGTYLEQYAEELVEYGVDYIDISVDSIEDLKAIRGIDIDVVARGIAAVTEAKQRKCKNHPALSINFVGMFANIDGLPKVIKWAKEHNIQKVNVVHLMAHDESLKNENLFYHMDEAEKAFAQAQIAASEHSVRLTLPSLQENTAFCSRPFRHIYINWNGDIRPCCFATLYEDDALILGNAKNAPLMEVWLSEKFEKIRNAMLTGQDMPAFCRRCPERTNSKEMYFRKL